MPSDLSTPGPAPSTIEILSGLDRLRAAWARTKAGKGGYAALAGFEFQITQVTFELIRSESSGGGLVLMEALSDTLRHDGGLVVSQLKRTLSSSALHKALEELWQIESLARKVAPEIRSSIRYQVQAAHRDLKNVSASLMRWTPEPPFDVDALTQFKARVCASVVSDPRLESARLLVDKFVDPAPFHTVDRFAGILLRAGDGDGMDKASEEIRVLLAAMRASATERSVEFKIWGENDRAPLITAREPDPRKAVRVGQKLGIADLIAGRLADRRSFAVLHDAAEDWLSGYSDGADKIPTFWIEGRSGAGKSAALLHLLAKLHEEDPQRLIVWLGSRSERFGDILKRFRDVVEEGRQLIVAIDDPLAPDQQQAFIAAAQAAADEWTRLSDSGDRDVSPQPPCLICCGPTEQREYGEDNCYAELEITPWPLAAESAEDIQELTQWYEIRTGKRPPDLQGDVLLVQRFFEWDLGNVRDFALRFKRRLEGFGPAGHAVFELVARILAFGRLYADYPAHALQAAIEGDANVGRAFDRLSDEEAHLTFQADGDGVRMTHPHLADAIYREWFGRSSDGRARKAHLADGIQASLAQRERDPGLRLAPLWAIARLIRGPETGRAAPLDLRERLTLIDREVRELLPETYAGLQPTQAGPSELPVWLVLDQSFGLNLSPSPGDLLKQIIDTAVAPRQGLRLSCHVLLASTRRLDTRDPHASVAQFLDQMVDWRDDDGLPWREWAYIAADLIQKGGASLIVDDILWLVDRAPKWPSLKVPVGLVTRKGMSSEAITVASAWLAATQDAPQHWVGVLRVLHERRLAVPDLGEHSARFLLAAPRHRAWPTIWKATIESGLVDEATLVDLGLAWLGLRPEAGIPVAGFEADDYYKVLVPLLARKPVGFDGALQQLGLAWLGQSSPMTGGWSYVWSSLWKDNTLENRDLDQLQTAGLTALEVSATNREWSFIWHALVKNPRAIPQDPLFEMGLDWLGTVPFRHSGWVFVWETLHDLSQDRETRRPVLRALALDWLLKVPQHNGWSSIWEKQRFDRSNDPAVLIRIGYDWLRDASPDHASWRFVAHQIIPRTSASDPCAERFAEASCAWLRSHPDDRHWAQIFQDLSHLLTHPELDRLETQAVERSRRNGGPAPRLIKAMLKRQPSADRRRELLAEVAAWLPDHFDDTEWNMSWTLLASSADAPVSAETLLDVAALWSDAHGPMSRGWPHLWPSWHHLLRLHRPAELPVRAHDALACLLTLPLTHRQWPAIWETIRRDAPDLLQEPAVLARQAMWLRQPIRDTDKWARVFKGYKSMSSDWALDRALTARLFDWLDMAHGDEKFWPETWKAVRILRPGDPEVQAKGIGWLESQPRSRVGWAAAWRTAMQHTAPSPPPGEGLVVLGKAWLSEQPNQGVEWHQVRALLDNLDPAISEKIEEQVADLRARPDAPGALEAWLDLHQKRRSLAHKLGTPVLVSVLINGDPGTPAWRRAWSILMKKMRFGDADPALGNRALTWLEGPTRDDPGWPWIWSDLWTRWPMHKARLTQIGRDWLRGRAFTGGRKVVQKALFGPVQPKQKKTPGA